MNIPRASKNHTVRVAQGYVHEDYGRGPTVREATATERLLGTEIERLTRELNTEKELHEFNITHQHNRALDYMRGRDRLRAALELIAGTGPNRTECAMPRMVAAQALSGEPSPDETSGDEQLRNAVEPILLGIGKIRVAICWSEDDPNKILRELVIYDDEGGYKPPGTDVLEHRGKKATEVGRILARLRVMSADGAEVFAADLRKVIEHTRSAEKAKEGQS